MPIYEFSCSKCDHQFEALVPRPGAKAPCPECGGKKVKQAISRPGGFNMKGSAAAGGTCPETGAPMPESCQSGP